ncbi:hypothetical protein AVEN_145680-1, partial [Araneus ventricosus]
RQRSFIPLAEECKVAVVGCDWIKRVVRPPRTFLGKEKKPEDLNERAGEQGSSSKCDSVGIFLF